MIGRKTIFRWIRSIIRVTINEFLDRICNSKESKICHLKELIRNDTG